MFVRILIAALAITLGAASQSAAQTAAITVAGPTWSTTISDAELARWTELAGADDALGYLIEAAWLEGEASERGIVVTTAEVEEELRDMAVGLGFDGPSDRRFRRHVRDELDRTVYELRAQLRSDRLRALIRDQITEPAAKSVTPQQIEAYVQAHPRTDPEERRVRIVRTRHRVHAKRALTELKRGRTWRSVRNRYDFTDGSGIETWVANPRRTTLDKAIFKAPKRTPTRYGKTVFEVTRITPQRPTPPDVQRAQAWEILSSEAQKQALKQHEQAFITKWRARTTCRPPLNNAHTACGNPPTDE